MMTAHPVHEVTTESPYKHSPESETYGSWPLTHHQTLKKALEEVLKEPFRDNTDLRGAQVTLRVAKDGLSVYAVLDEQPFD